MSGTAGVVTFDYTAWSGQYPELAAYVSAPQAQGYFSIATLYLDNTPGSIVQDATPGGQRATLLYMLTAHVAKLLASNPAAGGAPSDIVGRMHSVSQGSVSLASEMPSVPSAAWFNQTRYGAMFWQATIQFRSLIYRRGPMPYLGVGADPRGG